MCKTVDDLNKSNKEKEDKIDKLIHKIECLENAVAAKDNKIKQLESSLNQLEQYTRKNNIVVNGLSLKQSPTDYAGAVGNVSTRDFDQRDGPVRHRAGGGEMAKFQFMKDQAKEFFRNTLRVEVNDSDISAVHELRKGPRDKTAPLIIAFTNSAVKQDIMFSKKTLRNQDIYINDQLTATNGALFKQARDLRKQGQLLYVWTRFGKLFVKKTAESQAKEIRSPNDLIIN